VGRAPWRSRQQQQQHQHQHHHHQGASFRLNARRGLCNKIEYYVSELGHWYVFRRPFVSLSSLLGGREEDNAPTYVLEVSGGASAVPTFVHSVFFIAVRRPRVRRSKARSCSALECPSIYVPSIPLTFAQCLYLHLPTPLSKRKATALSKCFYLCCYFQRLSYLSFLYIKHIILSQLL
jgi:hypothetical protein